jgi:proteasomal ATPase-associated factor 1
MESLPLCLPVVTIQPSFTEVIQEVHDGIIPSDKFWVSCYKNSEPSVHAKVNVELDEVDRDLLLTRTIEGDVDVTRNLEGVSELS